MGWFLGGKGNNPIDQVQIPEDQMPPEVEKPGSISKAMQSENSEFFFLKNQIRKINLKSVYEIIAIRPGSLKLLGVIVTYCCWYLVFV